MKSKEIKNSVIINHLKKLMDHYFSTNAKFRENKKLVKRDDVISGKSKTTDVFNGMFAGLTYLNTALEGDLEGY